MSDYVKTGKRFMCIDSKRVDLTYKKVYDVFSDKSGYEFLIDEAGDRRYESMEFPLWCEVFDDDDYSHFEVVEQKPKFKVGDVVKVTSTDFISQFNKSIDVGDIGIITHVDNNDGKTTYCVDLNETGGKSFWWLTDKCIELFFDNSPKTPIKSDGGSSGYYVKKIPPQMLDDFNSKGVIEAKDVMRLFLGNDFNMSNVFKAYCRVISLRNGEGKDGVTELYDLNKTVFFAQDELDNYLKYQPSDGSNE